MNKRLRTAIFTLFIALFVLTTPVVLLWTAGYRLNWQRHTVQKAGLLYVETTPRGASVTIDGEPQKRFTPSSYGRLLPEDYDVLIEKDGYLPWRKRLEVKSGETTFATGVVLYRDVLPSFVAEKNVVSSAWSADGRSVAYVSDADGVIEVGLRGTDARDVLLARFPGEGVRDAKLAWSPRGDMVLFTAEVEGADRAYRYDVKTATLLALHDRFADGKLSAHWTADGSIAAAGTLGAYLIDAASGGASPLLSAKNVQDADVRDRTAYVLRLTDPVGDAQSVELLTVTGGTATALASLPMGRYSFALGSDTHLLLRDEGRRRLLVMARGGGSAETFDATGYAWEPEGLRLLIWNDYEISIVSPADGERVLVTRLGTSITQAAWSPRGDGVIYGTPDGIAYVELDARDQRNVHDLARCTLAGDFALRREPDVLRFGCTVGSQRGFFDREL